MGRRNHDRYTAADWKEAGPTVGAILANRWLVYTGCDLCELRFVILAKAGARRPETHRPRAGAGLRPVGARCDLPADGLSGPGCPLGAAAWRERGCGDDVRVVPPPVSSLTGDHVGGDEAESVGLSLNRESKIHGWR